MQKIISKTSISPINRSARFFSSPGFAKQSSALIVGAGLSGLSTGIRLRQLGIPTKIIERQPYPGGLCHNQGPFEIGCTCVGKGIEAMMQELGVDQSFKQVNHQIVFPEARIQVPFNARSVWNLFYPVDLIRLGYNLKQSTQDNTLEQVTDNLRQSPQNMFRGLVAYPLFRSPEEISLPLAGKSLKNDYGYDQPRVPIGGMSALINAMVNRFETLGGHIDYDSMYDSFLYHSGGQKKVKIIDSKTGKERLETTDVIISSMHGWAQYPKTSKPSLKVSSLLLTVSRKHVNYPEGTHTLMFLPKDSTGWLKAHENGKFAPEFGFHCFNNDVMHDNPQNEVCNISVYFLTPRGKDTLSDTEQQTVTDYMINTMNKTLPGLKDAILETQFYSPDDYEKTFHLNSAVSPCIPSQGFHSDCYNKKDDMYYVGNATNDDGEQHAEGAILSAKNTVNEIIRREKNFIQQSTTPHQVSNRTTLSP